ncbi:MAG TPA: RNA methyltransferase [Drouetiella sp.]
MTNSVLPTKCPYPDCRHCFDIALLATDPKATRPVVGGCPVCGRMAGFKPLSVVEKLEREVGKNSKNAEQYIRYGGSASSSSSEDVPVTAGADYPKFHRLTVLVEDVRSLWNVGSIFRTADGAGFDEVILTGITGSPPRKEIAKVSLGAEEQLDWRYFVSSVDIVPELKAQGVLIIGLEKNTESAPLHDVLNSGRVSSPLCLIVGNEVTGLSPESLALCDIVCELPMRGFKESLNVSVAFGVAAYQISASVSARIS